MKTFNKQHEEQLKQIYKEVYGKNYLWWDIATILVFLLTSALLLYIIGTSLTWLYL